MTEITLPNEQRRDYVNSFLVAATLTLASYLVAYVQKWITEINSIEFLAVFTSYACTYLCYVQRRFNYVIGAISTLAFSLLFWQADLIASALLNLYLTPQLLYGWFRWNRDEVTRPVTSVTWKQIPIYALMTGLFYAGASILVKLAGGQMAFWDTVILIGSIAAQWLLDNKKLQTWHVWAVVNVVAISVYWSAGLKITAFQYLFFLFGTFYGYYSWRNK